MKRAIDIGPLDAAAIRTRGGKIRLRLHFTVEQLESMLRAAMADDDGDEETTDANVEHLRRSVTQCDAPESEKRRGESKDGDDARARPPPTQFVVKGSRAWEAWGATRRQPWPTTWAVVNGDRREGWYFPTLFPPDTSEQTLSKEDSDAFTSTT